MRIVIGCDTFPPDINGAARFAERLAAGLVLRGHEVHVIAPASSKVHGRFIETHDGVDIIVHRIKSVRWWPHATLRYVWPYTFQPRANRLIRDIAPDAVHSQSQLIVGRYLSRAAKKQGVRLVATNHIMPENLIRYTVIIPNWFKKTAMRLAWLDAGRVLRLADYVTTPTRRAAELLEAASGLTGVLAISCGIDASKFANTAPTSNHPPRVLFVGRLDFEKHIHNLLKAVALLPESLGVLVEIVGDGSERKALTDLASSLGINERVNFLGHITETELPLAYGRATVFAMPSIAELQSIATMEAMASGRPVVAADAMALPHLVHDGDNGYLFEPDNVEMFADRLLRIFTADEAELERLSANSLHLIQAHDINRTLDIFENLYRGETEDSTTDDNLAAYAEPIGVLSAALQDRVNQLRTRSRELRLGASELRDRANDRFEEVQERLDDLRDEVLESVKRAGKKVKRGMRKAAENFKASDD
jgi:glycosyltransferase involved in cell wall biosynthesis